MTTPDASFGSPGVGNTPLTARQAALHVLTDRATHIYGREALDGLMHRGLLPAGERALALELVMGVHRHRLTLTRLLSPLCKHGWENVSMPLRQILLMAAYQLIWLDGIPDYAAVAEAVELAKRQPGGRAGQFVNALLRQIQRDIETLRLPTEHADPTRSVPVGEGTSCQFRRAFVPDPRQQPIDHLSVLTSHPTWLVSRWISAFGFERAEQICLAGATRPPMVLRPNRLKCDARQLQAALRQEEIEAHLDRDGRAVRVSPSTPIGQLNAFTTGLFQVQDRTAMSVVEHMAPRPGDTVIDLCAGVGTKATQLAEWMDDRGRVIASDRDAHRLEMLATNARRLGLSCIQTVNLDQLPDVVSRLDRIDWILVDVPCSNTGVLARRPEARYRLKEQTLRDLQTIQLQILERAVTLCKPGTRIMYGTCSLEIEENEALITVFLQSHTDWRLSASERTLTCPAGPATAYRDGGYWAVLAPVSGTNA